MVPEDHINGTALNIYLDKNDDNSVGIHIGIAPHFDCYSRFDRPIVTLRLYTGARLTLGGQELGENATSVIDLPRGAVLSLQDYAADGVKHCVRPRDMKGKSAAMIMRRHHPKCMEEALRMAKDNKAKREAEQRHYRQHQASYMHHQQQAQPVYGAPPHQHRGYAINEAPPAFQYPQPAHVNGVQQGYQQIYQPLLPVPVKYFWENGKWVPKFYDVRTGVWVPCAVANI